MMNAYIAGKQETASQLDLRVTYCGKARVNFVQITMSPYTRGERLRARLILWLAGFRFCPPHEK